MHRMGMVVLAVLTPMAAFPQSRGARGGTPDEIQACVGEPRGLVRIVPVAGQCRANEAPLSWNRVGPAGPQGPSGPPGPRFAFVNIAASTGQILSQSAGTGALLGTRLGIGFYAVDYDRDLTFCPRYVSVLTASGARMHAEAQAVAPGDPTNPGDPNFRQRRMLVRTFAAGGTDADTFFTLYTQCP